MVGVGFIGVGGMGMAQVKAFEKAKRCKTVAGADLSETARSAFKAAQPQAEVYDDYRKLLDDKNVDAVVIVVPTLLHKDIAIDAMKAGKHVLTEKPMARTVKDCKAMLKAEKETGKLLMVAHCRRYDPNWLTFANVVEKEKIGRPVMWRQMMSGMGPQVGWFMDDKLGGGPMIDGAVHNYDFGNMMFGDPQRVICKGIKLRDHVSALTTATAVVEYPHGDLLQVSWSWATPGYQGAHDILGAKATLVFGPAGQEVDKNDPKGTVYFTIINDKGKKQLVKGKSFKRGMNMYELQAQHFIDCIDGKTKQCLTPGSEAIKAVAVAEAILTTAQKGGAKKISW